MKKGPSQKPQSIVFKDVRPSAASGGGTLKTMNKLPQSIDGQGARTNNQKKKTTMIMNKNFYRGQSIMNMENEEDNDAPNIDKQVQGPDRSSLTAEQLDEDMPPRMLQALNPQAPKNLTHYNYKERKYETNSLVDQLTIHFAYDGDRILLDSEEAKIQEDIQDFREKEMKEAMKKAELEFGDSDVKEKEKRVRKTLRNKFNYGERQTQTPSVILREKGLSTDKPRKKNFSGEINQAIIFDRYLKDIEANKEKEDKKSSAQETEGTEEKPESQIYRPSFRRCLKIMERMIVQNGDEQKYNDYRYMFNTNSGVENQKKIYGLWRFSYTYNKRKAVTCLQWNPRYPDLFAAGFGTYDFGKKKFPGSICCFSIKNWIFPEFVYQTEEPVMALNFHPKSPSLLAVGLYYGTVLVFDLRNKSKKPLYQSTIKTNKHTDVVWQVAWDAYVDKDLLYRFYSISADGRVMRWVLMKNKLEPEEVIRLKLVNKKNKPADEETSLVSLAVGLCFDFNPHKDYETIFIVGTEEGNIHRCSTAYSGQYQETYDGHQLAVYKVRWHPRHNKCFLSASADWTVKIWHSDFKTPIMSFENGQPFVDACWSPFSSTIFIALSLEKMFVYDLAIDKQQHIDQNKPIKVKCTNLALNETNPIVLVGDYSGGICAFKLSTYLTAKRLQQGPAGQMEPGFEKLSIEVQEFKRIEQQLLLSGATLDK